MADTQDFTIGYFPDAFTKRPYILGREKNHADALRAASEYARTYYGECSPIMVFQGKKKIHTIPRNAGRQ